MTIPEKVSGPFSASEEQKRGAEKGPDTFSIYASRPIKPELLAVLDTLQPGQRIKITQLMRVGLKTWPVTITGVFRHVDSLATGLATERYPRDDIIVPVVHFTKDNQEMSSVTLDEHTKIEVIS